MSINLKIVDEYPKDILDALVKKNLEADGIFIPSWEYYFDGDNSYEMKGKTVRVGFDGEINIPILNKKLNLNKAGSSFAMVSNKEEPLQSGADCFYDQ